MIEFGIKFRENKQKDFVSEMESEGLKKLSLVAKYEERNGISP